MSSSVYFPSDEFVGGGIPDLDLAADYLELKALFSGRSFSQDLVNALEDAAENEYEDVDTEIRAREEIASGAESRILSRQRILSSSYPFKLDESGSILSFAADRRNNGTHAYLVSLLLSNLRAQTPLLQDAEFHPSDDDVRGLRRYFQYFATAAIAAEVGGPAWSFGAPRPDGTGFRAKLSEIWSVLGDGYVRPDPTAPKRPQDDGIDVFAWREQTDGLPGFLLVAAQVATGGNWKDKSLLAHVDRVFHHRWFGRPPATRMVPYHVIPFARPDEAFRDDVLVLGNVLHRLRVPRRVAEAEKLVRDGMAVEAFDKLGEASDWIDGYLARIGR